MKRVTKTLAALLIALCAVAAFAGCGKKNVSGTYKFESMKTEVGGISAELKVGEKYMGLITLSEDFMTYILNEDGTVEIKALDTPAAKGTWELNGSELSVTVGAITTKGECNGKTIVIAQDGNMLTLRKK